MRRVSKKRAKTNVLRRAEAERRFGQRPRCHACGPLALVGVNSFTTGCRGMASDLHEVTSRARSGLEENLVDMDGCLPVSRECHAFLTTHPDVAEAAGLALPSKPVRQPLRVRDPKTGAMR